MAPSSSPQTVLHRAPRVEQGTAAANDPDGFEAAIAETPLDPRLWTGAFASNVWGGRYAVDGVLGSGGQGTTFIGTDQKTSARVALKMFDLSRAADWKAVELFDREVQTLKDVTHPLMPQFMDVISDADTGARVLVMTHVPGDALHTVVKREGPLAEAALWTLLVDVADVLASLHGHRSPIVHRDLKPQNLIRRGDGKVCVVDFGGVGRVKKEAGSTVVGTFGYMAPEQLYGAQTPATDLYALGATALFLATGKQPEDLPRDGLRIDVDAAAPQLSLPLRALLKKLVSPEPKERPRDAQALLQELRDISNAVHRGERDVEPVQDDAQTLKQPGGDADLWIGIVAMVFGLLGVAGAVVIGRVILPLVLTVLASVSGPDQRRRLLQTRDKVHEAAKLAQRSFQNSAEHGAKRLEQVNRRDRDRRDERQREKHQRKEQRRMDRSRRRDGKFWT